MPHDPAALAGRAGPLHERLIVALDVPGIEEAKAIVERLDGIVSFFKIGPWLQFSAGLDVFIKSLVDADRQVFWDPKLSDIPETVKKGVADAAALGVRFITVHGGDEILRAAVEASAGTELKILCLTVLTSLNEESLREFGYSHSVEELVTIHVKKAVAQDCDGVIASAHEAKRIREIPGADRLLIVTPGIRPEGASRDDHKRSATPAQAIAAGADYLVVGRPIIRNPDPATAARGILDDMRRGAADYEGVKS